MVILCGFNLYTGKIGNYNFLKDGCNPILEVFGLNVLGASFMSLYFQLFSIPEALMKTVTYKNSLRAPQLLVSSILCGALMYLAVELSKISKNREFIVIIAVGAFIIAKFDHSIADAFYFSIDGISLLDFERVLLIGIGNGVGAKALRWLKEGKI